MPPPSPQLPIDDIVRASRDPRKVRSIEKMFAEVDAEMASCPVACRRCGRCCRFESYDHHLFVTPMELAYLLAEVGAPSESTPILPGSCAYQIKRECSIHSHRVLGCRIFLCDSPKNHAAESPGERWHRALVQLHRANCVPYLYVEWREAIRQLSDLRGVATRHLRAPQE